jgi:hypothetical protein
MAGFEAGLVTVCYKGFVTDVSTRNLQPASSGRHGTEPRVVALLVDERDR